MPAADRATLAATIKRLDFMVDGAWVGWLSSSARLVQYNDAVPAETEIKEELLTYVRVEVRDSWICVGHCVKGICCESERCVLFNPTTTGRTKHVWLS